MNQTKRSILCWAAALSFGVGAASCDEQDDVQTRVAEADPLGGDELVEAAPAADRDAGPKHRTHFERKPAPTMPDAQETFEEVVDLIEAKYVDGPLPEDVLWTAAAQGVLSRLIQVRGAEINTLMSPRDLNELKIGTKGQLVGVGVMIEMVADVVVVREVIPGGPAEAAGLQGGDRILGIDGERLKGKTLVEIVDKIRGSEGTNVSLFVQRDTEEWDAELTRARIDYSSVDSRMLGDSVGYLRIFQFSASTAKDVTTQLEELKKQGMQTLVLDMRDCPGGLLDASLEVAELFLPAGHRVMSVVDRDSQQTHLDAERDDPFDDLPIVALVGPYTASGAEILAAALQHHERARVVGSTTLGKGTVEAIHELSNGWGLKLSVSRFMSATGEPMLGRGVTADIEIPSDEKPRRSPIDEVDPGADAQLSAALALARD